MQSILILTNIFKYAYICVCMCVCACVRMHEDGGAVDSG